MNYFSIDEAIEQIKQPYTKEIFKEVHSSYAMGNYRSAVVMLWSVVVTDLMLKLKELESVYADAKATSILENIKREQTNNPTSSKWEIDIIKKFQIDFNFFDTPEVAQMQHLQNMRHVSAHPVIGNNDALYMPNKALVYSLIQNALEAVLIKDALFSSKVIDIILSDLSNVKNVLTNFEDKERYFCHKFLNKTSDVILIKLIKTLWKFSFRVDNDDVEENRQNNLDILKIILKNRKETFIKFLTNERDFISNIEIEEKLVINLLKFISPNRYVLQYFHPQAISTLKEITKTQGYHVFEIVRFDKIMEYVEYLLEPVVRVIPFISFDIFRRECEDENILNIYYDVCVDAYLKSDSFERADVRFEFLIKPHINEFTLEQLKKIVIGSDKNYQIYARKRSSKDNKILINRIVKDYKEFDLENYENFIDGNLFLIESKSMVRVDDFDLES